MKRKKNEVLNINHCNRKIGYTRAGIFARANLLVIFISYAAMIPLKYPIMTQRDLK